MLVRTHMQDLKDVTRETHYENYRAHCIQSMTRMVVKERNRKYGAREKNILNIYRYIYQILIWIWLFLKRNLLKNIYFNLSLHFHF